MEPGSERRNTSSTSSSDVNHISLESESWCQLLEGIATEETKSAVIQDSLPDKNESVVSPVTEKYERNFVLVAYEKIKEENGILSRRVKVLEAVLEEKTSKLSSNTLTLEKNNTRLYEVEVRNKSLQELCERGRLAFLELENKVPVLERSIKSLKVENDRLTKQLEESYSACRYASLQELYESERLRVLVLDNKVEELEKANGELMSRILNLEHTEANLKQNLEESTKSSLEMMNTIDSMVSEARNVKRLISMEKEELLNESEMSLRNFTKVNDDFKELSANYERASKMLEDCKESLFEKTSQLISIDHDLIETKNRLTEIESLYDSLKKAHESLRKSHEEVSSELSEKSVVLRVCEMNLELSQRNLAEARAGLQKRISQEELFASHARCRELERNIECMRQTLSDTMSALTRQANYEDQYAACARELEQTRLRMNKTTVKLVDAVKELKRCVPIERLEEAEQKFAEELRANEAELAAYGFQLEKQYNEQLTVANNEVNNLRQTMQAEYDQMGRQLLDKNNIIMSLQLTIDNLNMKQQQQQWRYAEKEGKSMQQLLQLDSLANERVERVKRDYETQLGTLHAKIAQLEDR